MSIEYRFIKKKTKDDSEKLLALLERERAALTAKLEVFAEEHPDMEGNVESIIFALRRDMSSLLLDLDQDDHIIGVAVSRRFDWRSDNGFCGISDVQKFLEKHPGFIIQNDYGDEISLTDFKSSIKSRYGDS